MTLKPKKILVAATADAQSLMQRYLTGTHELVFAETISRAKSLLDKNSPEDKFDLVVAGIHFDDSRAFELLKFIRDEEHLHYLPFVIIRALPYELPDAVRTAEPAARLLGTCAWLDDLYTHAAATQ